MPFPLDAASVLTKSESELFAAVKTGLTIYDADTIRVVRISEGHVIKYGPTVCIEEATMALIGKEVAGIRTPRVFRAWSQTDCDYGTIVCIVMEYIEGNALQKAWTGLTDQRREELVGEIAHMVYAMQHVELEKARTVMARIQKRSLGNEVCHIFAADNDGQALLKITGALGGDRYRGVWFYCCGTRKREDRDGFQQLFNEKLFKARDRETYLRKLQRADHAVEDVEATASQDPCGNLVFDQYGLVHGDLAPRNFILASTEELYLIDWESAGVFPTIFEVATLRARLEEAVEPEDGPIEFYRRLIEKLENDHDQTQLQLMQYLHSTESLCDYIDEEEIVPWEDGSLHTESDAEVEEIWTYVEYPNVLESPLAIISGRA